MKLYGGKFLRLGTQRQIQQRVETRDAILWDVSTGTRTARVKIQGSATLVVAHYPENWETTPVWLKPGNSVRIVHVGGIRGRIELAGHGATIPTAVSGDSAPPASTGADAVLSGLNLSRYTGLTVAVGLGSVRFSGTTSTVSVKTLGGTTTLGGVATLGSVAGLITFNAAPAAGTYRYDLVVIGSDLVFDKVTGTASATPVMPDVPTGHLLCGWVLLAPGCTEITSAEIGGTFTPAVAKQLTLSLSDSDLAWGETTSTITATVKDQFGNAISGSWQIVLSIDSGNGTVSYGSSSSSTSVTANFSGSSAVFTYTRGGADPGDSSPSLTATLTGITVAAAYIILRNSGGDIMI